MLMFGISQDKSRLYIIHICCMNLLLFQMTDVSKKEKNTKRKDIKSCYVLIIKIQIDHRGFK